MDRLSLFRGTFALTENLVSLKSQLTQNESQAESMKSSMNPVDSLSPESQHWLAIWKAAARPIRPSPEDVEAMTRWWTLDAARVLVQGVTPELVDLAVRRAFRVFSAERTHEE